LTATLRREVRAAWPVRLPRRGAPDGTLRVRAGVLERLLHVEGDPVVVRVAQRGSLDVLFEGRSESEALAEEGIRRMRFALGVDDDLRAFHEAYRYDPLIGPAVRADPTLRVRRRPDPWEALAWAITEQLIEYARAAAIQRRIVRALGPRCSRTGLRAVPTARSVAGLAPARLCAWDLTESRALALVKAAREVASGRADLAAPDPEPAWRRLRAIRGVGRWTMEVLAVNGHGRLDVLPAGDLGYLKLVGRLITGDPQAIAEEDEVRSFFARFGRWQSLAAAYAYRTPAAASVRVPMAAAALA
jgi:DNA-3-methyladenine glycosylase II